MRRGRPSLVQGVTGLTPPDTVSPKVVSGVVLLQLLGEALGEPELRRCVGRLHQDEGLHRRRDERPDQLDPGVVVDRLDATDQLR